MSNYQRSLTATRASSDQAADVGCPRAQVADNGARQRRDCCPSLESVRLQLHMHTSLASSFGDELGQYPNGGYQIDCGKILTSRLCCKFFDCSK